MFLNRDGPQPKPGDLIEIFFHHHTHWALYVGNGYVVHLTHIEINVAAIALGNDTQGVVQKELLTTLTSEHKYRVNNKHDEKKPPLRAKEIVQRADVLVGKKLLYTFTNYNCEHFATELRYGVPLSDQKRIGPWPKPGDLIEIFREAYEHWALYVGDGYVIHLTGTEHEVAGLGSVLSAEAIVLKEPLTMVTAGCQYQVNNKYDEKMRPLPAKKIISEAEKLVGKVMNYNLATDNCEHFVTKLRYEEPRSDQVWEKIAFGIGLGLGVILLL